MKVPQRRQLNNETAFVPEAYTDVRPDANAFGAANAHALANVAGGVRDLTNAAIAMKQQNDDMQLLDLSNKLSDFRTKILYDKENGYLLKQGEAAAGKTDEVMQSFTDGAMELLNQSKLYGSARKRAEALVGRMTSGLYENVSVHDYNQTAVRDKTILDNTFNSRNNILVQNRNNPNAAEAYLADINTAADIYAKAQKIGDEAKTALIMSANNIGLSQLLTAYAADDNYDKLAEVFQKYSDKLSPENQAKFQHVITNHEKDKLARQQAENLINLNEEAAYEKINAIENTADRNRIESEYKRLKAQKNEIEDIRQNEFARQQAYMLVDMPVEAAYQKINEIDDITLRNKVEREFSRLSNQRQTIQKQKDFEKSNEIMQRVYYAYENGEDVSAIMREVNVSDMSLEQKNKIYKNIKTMQELQGVGDNWVDYNILLDMAAFDNENFKNVNPANYNLTKEQYNKIVEMQRKSANNEYTPETQLKEAIHKMYNPTFNFQAKDGLHSNEYQNELIRFLSKVERLQGKAFDLHNKTQLQAILQGFDYKDENAVNKNIDETKELFTRAKKHGEAYKLMAQEYMRFKVINRREPSPEEIFEMSKKTYNTIENEWRIRDYGKLNYAAGLYQSVISAVPKRGETQVLTYYADVRIPQISRELGIPLQVTSRFRPGDSGGHGKGRKCDIGMAALNESQRITVFERLLSEPGVASIGTSDTILLKRFNNPPNPKIRDLRVYDSNYKKLHPNTTMNHVNHIDVSFDTRYGGDTQGK